MATIQSDILGLPVAGLQPCTRDFPRTKRGYAAFVKNDLYISLCPNYFPVEDMAGKRSIEQKEHDKLTLIVPLNFFTAIMISDIWHYEIGQLENRRKNILEYLIINTIKYCKIPFSISDKGGIK